VVESGSERSRLRGVLARLDRVARLYQDTALRFECREKFRVTNVETGRRVRESLAYVYADEDGTGPVDVRLIRRGRGGKARSETVTPERFHIKSYVKNALLFIFLFEKDRWSHYDYRLRGEETILDRRALRVDLVPQIPIERGVNEWLGAAWFDAETLQPLRFEGYQYEDVEKREALRRDLERAPQEERSFQSQYDLTKIEAAFGVEKNGMRFPSRVTLLITRHRVLGGDRRDHHFQKTRLQTVQEYDQYRFFSVRTREEILRLTRADGP
jgi:hypothetical protein